MLSVVITAHNSQQYLQDCLNSVAFADEIIVIDNQSTDDTAAIAKTAGAKVYPHHNDPTHLNQSKNFGFTKATGDWILSLDTDERVEPELGEEIQTVIQAHRSEVGYLIPRHNVIFGKIIKHGLWYPDHQLRLFRTGAGKFPNIHNHELLKVEGPVGYLKHHIRHLNYQTVTQYLNKIDKQYSDNEAATFIAKGNRIHWYDAIRFPAQDFLTNFFARQGYQDGLHGLVLSLLQSFYMFIVFLKIWELQGFKSESVTLTQSKDEFHRFASQLKYWYWRERQTTAPPWEKLLIKIRSLF